VLGCLFEHLPFCLAAGNLPATANISYTLNSNNSCGAVVQKTERNRELVFSNTKYQLESSTVFKTENNTNKQSNNNCINIDGSPNEWNAMNTYGYVRTGSLTHVKVADNSTEILFYIEGGLDVNNQIYINSDVNHTTLNRYSESQWQNRPQATHHLLII